MRMQDAHKPGDVLHAEQGTSRMLLGAEQKVEIEAGKDFQHAAGGSGKCKGTQKEHDVPSFSINADKSSQA
jgi:hypothetical protein